MTNACKKAVTYLAENSGIIAALAQQEILTGDPDYALTRIKEAKYDVSKGHSPRWVRVRTTPPRRVKYGPMLPTGNTTFSVQNPQTGVATTVTGDVTGRGCALPAEKISYGYDTKNRCLMGKALEAGPWCIMDLLEKEAFRPLLAQLWRDLPRYAKEDFGRQLLRDVQQFAHYLFSVAEGFPMSKGGLGYFPAVPTGGPSIGFFRKVENLMMAQGYGKGADTVMVNGRPALQVRLSREAIEWAIQRRKEELGLTLDSRVYVDDGTWGKTVVYEGIQFIEAQLPTRGYLREIETDTFEFVEIDPFNVVPAASEGFWTEPNEDYYNSFVTVDGARSRVLEVAHIIHPMAMERQSLGAIPSVPGKTFSRNFDFTVESIPDYELADRGCNKDQFWFGYRMLHAYAPLPKNPELMTSILYLAPSNRYEITDPWSDLGTANNQQINVAALPNPRVSTCVPCDGQANDEAVDPTNPTCASLFPANGAGLIEFQSLVLSVDESIGGSLSIAVERVGGNVGVAGVTITLTEGTATSPENFDADTGTYWTGSGPTFTKALSWADGESGVKTVLVPIVEATGDDDGKVFTAAIGSATGVAVIADGSGSLADRNLCTVTILDTDNA